MNYAVPSFNLKNLPVIRSG